MVTSLERRLGRMEAQVGNEEMVTIPTADGDIIMTGVELATLMKEIDGKSRGLPQALNRPKQ